MPSKEIVFTVNGPGELAGVVLPLLKAFRAKYQDVVYTLYTVPCQFRSGLEEETARQTGQFDHVFSIDQYKKLWLKNQFPENYQPVGKGIIFYAGGDGIHAMILAKKYRYPAYAYTHQESALSLKYNFLKIFRPEIDGNLMVDAALERKLRFQALPIGSENLTVGLYPGSRPLHLSVMVPLLSAVAVLLNKKYPNIKFRWGINANLKQLFEKDYQAQAYSPIYEAEDTAYDLIISLTGTNTAISAVLGIPMLILLPFNQPKLVPFMGLFGLIAELPLFGPFLKYLALQIVKNQKAFISLPNINAKRLLVPELKGFLTPEQIAETAEQLLINISERNNIHQQLPIFMGRPGAANIADKFQEILK